MAGTRGILAALAIGSAIIALPAAAQSGSSSSLTHTVSVTVPPRVKVQVANLSLSTPGFVRNAASPTDGLSLSVKASRAWVLTVSSVWDAAASKSSLQWSSDSNSGFSTVTNKHVAVATGVRSFETRDANLFFRNGTIRDTQGERIVLTVAAP